MTSRPSWTLEDKSPADLGLSEVDYFAQARDGRDPLYEYGRCARDILAALLQEPLTLAELTDRIDWSSGEVRKQAKRLVSKDVLAKTVVESRPYNPERYQPTPECWDSEIVDAHRLWRQKHGEGQP